LCLSWHRSWGHGVLQLICHGSDTTHESRGQVLHHTCHSLIGQGASCYSLIPRTLLRNNDVAFGSYGVIIAKSSETQCKPKFQDFRTVEKESISRAHVCTTCRYQLSFHWMRKHGFPCQIACKIISTKYHFFPILW
jgi:hypothetical protein